MSEPKKIHPHHLSPEEMNKLPGKEMKERRTRASKTYSLGNGLYQTVIYPQAVHFRTPQGAWEDIDHSLTPEQGSFRDHSGDLSVKFSPGGSVTLTKDGHSLSWQISDASPVEAVAENAASPFPRHAAEKRIENKVTYTNLFNDVDLLCEVKPNRFKDTLVFKNATALQPVEFLLHTETLELQQNAVGDVLAQCGKKTVFRIPAPCITDEKGHIISNNAHAELTQLSAADWRMTYEVSPEFAAVADYPLFLDPGVETEQTGDAMVMAFTSSKEPDTPHPVTGYSTRISHNNSTLGECAVYLRFTDDALPDMDSSCYITNAVLTLKTDPNANNTGNSVFIREVMGAWDAASLTFQTPLNLSDFDLGYCNSGVHPNGENTPVGNNLDYDITNLVRKWYLGENNGVRLHVNSGDDVIINGPGSVYHKPYVTVTYVSLAGLESYLSQESHPCGRAGTAHVGLFNGNLVVSQPLTATNGHLLPVSVSRYYNSCYADQDLWGMGKGWKLSVQQSLHKETIGDTEYYIYTDGDGTQHHFKRENGKWQDQSGLSLTLTFEEAEAIITDKGDNRMVFDKPTLDIDEAFANAKMLKSITDPCGNTVSFTMNGRLPGSVKDGAGRDTIFTSSNGHITNITAPGMTDENCVSIVYENGQATRILHEDRAENTDSLYHYNDKGLLDKITHYDGSAIQIKYWDHKPYRVSEVFYLDKEGNASAGRRYTYGDCTTTVTDLIVHTSEITGENENNESGNSFSCGKKLKYHFNDAGNVLSVNDELGYGCFSGYNGDIPLNHPEYVSRMQRAVNNMLLHHNFQDTSNTAWVADIDNGAGLAGYQSHTTYMSGRSYMLKRTNDTGMVSAYQDISLVKGREYTFSVYYTNKSNARLRLRAEWQNASGETETAESFTPPITTVWKRLYVTFTLPQDALSDTVRLRMMAANGLGEIDLDAAQLEEGPMPNRYNLLSNSGFNHLSENGAPLEWYAGSQNTAEDNVRNSISLDRPTLLSDYCFHFEGEAGKEKSIQQTVSCIGQAGDAFVAGGWSRNHSIPRNDASATQYEMQILARRVEGDTIHPLECVGKVRWSEEWTGWHFGAIPVSMPFNYSEVGVKLVYRNNLNDAEFTSLFLHKEEFGSTFTYDANANVTAQKGAHSLTATANYDDGDNLTSYTPYGRSEDYSMDYGDTEAKRKQHLLRKQTSPLGIVTETDYDMDNSETVEEGNAHGLPMKSRVKNNRDNLKMETAYKYTDNKNYTLEQTDARGKTITTVTDENLGTVTSVTDPMGQTVSYEYDAMKRNTAVTTTVGEGDNAKTYKNTYEYQGDKLVKVAHNTTGDTCDVVYHFGFDDRNRATTVQVSNKLLPGENDTVLTLSTNEYNDDNTLKETTFGNGGKVKNTYDEFKRLKGVRYDSDTEDRYVYDYAANGQIAKVTDKNLNRVTVSEFDVANRPCQITTLENGSHLYNARLTYDEFSQPKSFQERVSGSFDFYRTDFAYDIEGKPTQIGYGLTNLERDDTKIVNAYDNLGRLSSRTVKVDGTSYATSYTYLPGPEENTTTSLIASISQGSGDNAENFVYTYDDNGNITSVSRNGIVTTYKYDPLGQLIRTDDPFDPISGSSSGTTWTFAYDRGGNIVNKKYYAFTTASDENGNPATPVLRTYTYTYDSDWKDKLTSYYGIPYTYDAIGNPLTDGTWNYTWEKGRQLRRMENSSKRVTFAYDASGMRIRKTVDWTDYTYYTYHGKNLVHLKKTGGTDMHFYYDAQNRPSIVNYNGSNYAYIYNLQGDVMALLDNTGAKVVEYAYNAWGKLLNTTGSMAATLGVLNPFRYRGYIYDEETGYYYLRSRYYYPNRGRFINADTLLGKKRILSHNLFTYCSNRCISHTDSSGFEDSPCILWYIRCAPNQQIQIAEGTTVTRGDIIISNGSIGNINERHITLKDGRKGTIDQHYVTTQKPLTIADVYGIPEMGIGKSELNFLHVQNLQRDLQILGYYTGLIDGVYGEQTADAVQRFGIDEELGTGLYAGPKVKNRLFEKVYQYYDHLQSETNQAYWNGYNDHKQTVKESISQ